MAEILIMEQLGEIGQRVEANVKPENIQHSTFNIQRSTPNATQRLQVAPALKLLWRLAFIL
jgi:hypothetical protein